MRLRTYIRKEEVNPLFKKLAEEKVFQLIESNYHLAGIYERKEEDDYYVYHLKKELLDKELVPFIENSIAYVMKATIRWIRRQFFLP